MQCRINFHDRDLQQFDWVKLDDTGAGVVDSGSSASEQLRNICANTSPVQVFLPQQDIHLTSAQLPPNASKQQLNAIAFSIEDQLADDVDNCFCAISGQREDGSVPVAVIERELMDDCIELLSEQHVNVREILAPVYLCPWSDAEDFLASVSEFKQGYLLRYGQHAGLYCEAAVLSQLLSLLKNQKPAALRVDFYADSVPDEVLDLGLEVYQNPRIDLLAEAFDSRHSINLKQKEYQSSHQWLELLKRWKFTLLLGSLLVLLLLSSSVIEYWNKNREYRALISQQQALLQRYLPELEPGNRPKQQLIRYLSAQQGQGRPLFMDMLHDFSGLISGFDDIKTSRIQYQQSQLLVNLQSKNLTSLESLRNRLAQSQFDAQIDNVNISPQQTTGRLVLQEAQ